MAKGPIEPEIILVFSSNTMILNAEDLLDERDLPFTLVPVPKEVNPNCGLAISLLEADHDLIVPTLRAAGIMPVAAWRRHGDDFTVWPLVH